MSLEVWLDGWWLVYVGWWLVAGGLPAAACRLPPAACRLPPSGNWLLATGYWLLAAGSASSRARLALGLPNAAVKEKNCTIQRTQDKVYL